MAGRRLKLERIALAICVVLIIVDLLPHPALSSGIIGTTLSKVQQAITRLMTTPN